MTTNEAIRELKLLRATAAGMDLVLDDGADEGDYDQNCAFAASYDELERYETKAARVSIDGISDDVLAQLWRESWPPYAAPHLPEDKYTHLMTYIDKLLEMIE